MSKLYKGYELIEELSNEKINNEAKIIPHYPNNDCIVKYFKYSNGFLEAYYKDGQYDDNVNVCIFLDNNRLFEIIEEIEVGEYCRTKLGEIFKVVRINEFNRNMFFDKQGAKYYKDDIVKYSKIKSEIVEIGDYVNGKRIHKIDKGPNYCYLYYGNCKTFVDYQIKTIWTKEQLKSIEYNV